MLASVPALLEELVLELELLLLLVGLLDVLLSLLLQAVSKKMTAAKAVKTAMPLKRGNGIDRFMLLPFI